MSVQLVTHFGLCVSDLGRALAFYVDALEFVEVGRLMIAGETVDRLLGLDDVDVEAVYLERDGFRLELLHYRSPGHCGEARPRPMNLLGMTHLSLRVTDLDEMCERIAAAGGGVLAETLQSNPERQSRFVMATDPDGTRLELIEAPGDPSLLPQGPRRSS